ncbi:MmcQ/YjbR family DNA-binding protein [Oscillospiraceae bacterium PP1C4]
MNYPWLDEYLLSKTGATKDFKAEWNAYRYLLGDKMFAMQGGDKEGKPIITLKCDPAFGQLLRKQYPYIIAGYYMNKEHWNSVYLDGDTPADVVRQMVDQSHELILRSLPKRLQKELEGSI